MKLLARAESNTKLRKSETAQYDIYGLSLAPARSAGNDIPTACANSSPACESACVGTACGMVIVFSSILQSRILKTRFRHQKPKEFRDQLNAEIRDATAKSARDGKIAVFRLDVFSDTGYERAPWHIPQAHLSSGALFYGYTKLYWRFDKALPENFFLTASWTERERDQAKCIDLLKRGHNIAVAFYDVGSYSGNRAIKQRLPRTYTLPGCDDAFNVFDGDASDLRLPGLDPGPDARGFGSIIGLRLKAGSSDTRHNAIEQRFALPIE